MLILECRLYDDKSHKESKKKIDLVAALKTKIVNTPGHLNRLNRKNSRVRILMQVVMEVPLPQLLQNSLVRKKKVYSTVVFVFCIRCHASCALCTQFRISLLDANELS